jgi:hypothetical protein
MREVLSFLFGTCIVAEEEAAPKRGWLESRWRERQYCASFVASRGVPRVFSQNVENMGVAGKRVVLGFSGQDRRRVVLV